MSDLCQWLTPDPVAQEFLNWARVGENDLVLEPAAGEGALVPNRPGVVAFELDRDMARELQYWRPDALVINADFLTVEPPIRASVGVLNPPYADDGEGKFIRQALAWAPRVCALVRTLALHGQKRFELCWRYVKPTRIAILTHRPRFLGPRGVPTKHNPEADYMAVECMLRDSPLPKNGHNLLTEVDITWVNWR